MSVCWTLMDVLRHVPTIHLGASHVHAMPATLSMLMAKLAMVGHTTTTWNETSLFYSKHIDRQTERLAIHKYQSFLLFSH